MVVATCLFFIALIPIVSANIYCATPQGGIYNIGDSMIFSWGSDDKVPGVSQVAKITATLWCTADKVEGKIATAKIATIGLPKVGPFTWPVPFVGNATTAGGNQGPCRNNAFQVDYDGEWKGGVFGVSGGAFGPVTCAGVTIMPAPNISFPITTTFERSTSTTTTKTTSSTATPTVITPVGPVSGVSTSVVIIIVVVAIVILVLAGIAVAWYLRKKRIERMEAVIMPWKRQDQQEFDKVSSAHGSRANVSEAGVHSAAAGVAAAGFDRGTPQSSSPNGGRYDAFDRQAPSGTEGAYQRKQRTYEDLDDEDNYYNPYYAQSAATAAAEAALPRGRPSYYSGFSTSDSPFSDPYPHQRDTKVYFPPPPSSNLYPNSSTTSLPLSSAIGGPHASGVYASSALNIQPTPSNSSSSGRAPQTIPEKGEHDTLPMQDMYKAEARKP
ncbi:hypothetical protein BGZ73_002317 [Actinomortierella ambigua]|nr:hypothetical protein BGZ73_002317 [Actinomortierella ambigua]